MKVFPAAPLFSEAERAFNAETAEKLRDNCFEVWLAQEAPFREHGNPEAKRMIYDDGISSLKTSDVVVAVLDGADVDSGVAYEVGYAKALGKLIVGLMTDYRTFSGVEEVNLMLSASVDVLCRNVSEVIEFLKT